MENKKIRKLGKKCPYKPPRPPRCLCRGFINWIFGIVSPSLWLVSTDKKAIEYKRKLNIYERKRSEWYSRRIGQFGKSAAFAFVDELHTYGTNASERCEK